ncbi:MAG: MFS transporter [Thermodesulfobacteriota bacterium]
MRFLKATGNTSPADPANPVMTGRTSYRWLVLALVWLLYVCHGIILRSASPLVTPMLKDLNMSYSQMGIVLGSWQLTYLVAAVAAGIIIDRWGLRKSLFWGALIMSLSAVLRYFAQDFGTLLPIVALFGVGGPMISIGAPKAIALFFTGRERGTAVGIYTTGPWVGQMSVLAATNAVVMPLAGYSWRLTFVIYGLFTFGAALLWWFLAEDPGPSENPRGTNFYQVIRHLLKVHNVRVILLAGLLLFAVSHGFNGWLPKLLENSGLSPATAGLLASLPYLTSIPAVLLIPRLTPVRYRGRMTALLALLAAATIILIAASAVPVWLSLLLYGIGGGSLVAMLILTLMETPGIDTRFMGAAGGMFFCISEIGGFFGPFGVGYLVDLTGSFLAGAIFLALLGVVIAALTAPLQSVPAAPSGAD